MWIRWGGVVGAVGRAVGVICRLIALGILYIHIFKTHFHSPHVRRFFGLFTLVFPGLKDSKWHMLGIYMQWGNYAN